MADDKFYMWTLIPNQYEWDIHLCLANNATNEQLLQVFNQNYNLQFEQEDWCSQINPCTLFNVNNRTAIIVLRSYNKRYTDYSILSHQILHIITMIAQQYNIPIDFDNTTEVWAYFMSFYMDICIQTLDQHLMQQKRKRKIQRVKNKNIQEKDK